MRWREFLDGERELFARAGLPGVLRDREQFDDFLMHGFIPMPGGLADGVMFSADELDPDQREALERLVELYVDRFGDPGVSLGPWPGGPHRRTLADGRVVVASRSDAKHWHCWIEGDLGTGIIGWPLAETLAETLGYNVAHEEWPTWIDRWAEEIGGEALDEPATREPPE